MTNLLSEILFIFQRLDWLAIVDILLVTLIFYGLLYFVRDTQAMALLRGAILLIVLIALLTSLVDLPAFSWLVRTALPAMVFVIPVIFTPEIRRALERIGRAGSFLAARNRVADQGSAEMIQTVVTAVTRLSARQHGALIILKRMDSLEEYIRTGVPIQAHVTPELLLQIFYPNTPLHDGAVIISTQRLVAAACVMPLSSSGILVRSPERQMGLRHRAALGISEVSDAVAVVVSEETGGISVAHAGRMIRRLDPERLTNVLKAFFSAEKQEHRKNIFKRIFSNLLPRDGD